MNKRQYKKARKKINKVAILDEFFLLDFTPEEYQNYLKDIEEYSYRHHKFKHYKDKVSGIIDFSYHPPMSKKRSVHFQNILKCARKFPVIIHTSSKEDFTYIKEIYKKNKYGMEI